MPEQTARSECPIVRSHKRFLLSKLEFSQQYAPMYRCRLEMQYNRTLSAIQRLACEERKRAGEADAVTTCRVLELALGRPSVCVGVVYKNMKFLPKFLEEYQKELVRIDAGDDDNEGEGGGVAELVEKEENDNARLNQTSEDATSLALAATNEHFNICSAADELMIEDSSGRVLLQGLNTDRFCTGVVLGVYGMLLPNGHMQVIRYCFSGLYGLTIPRPLFSTAAAGSDSTKEPCYIAFVCGLNVRAMPPEDSEAIQARTLLELLMDFISGNVGDADMLTKSRCISRLVIGGNSIAPTEELKLKKKVKLDPSDHVRLNDDKSQSGVVSSARLMREFDAVLARLAATVEVELMPGDNDMSDAFQPQQPLHPVLLPTAARHSTLRLVSNPFEFTALPGGDSNGAAAASIVRGQGAATGGGIRVFVTAGQNVNDVARETNFAKRPDTMEMILASGCACPTAPNTLFSYPFKDTDPFLFTHAPHCFVACDQPCFETRYVSYERLAEETSCYLASSPESGEANEELEEAEERLEKDGVRIVSVPSFERSGTIVLVDVHSPTLRATTVELSMR